MGQSTEPAGCDQIYILGIDETGRPRGGRFTVLKDGIVSAAMDMHYHALIRQPDNVSMIGMKLPIGTVHGVGRRVKLFIPNITWALYQRVVEAATAAQLEADRVFGDYHQTMTDVLLCPRKLRFARKSSPQSKYYLSDNRLEKWRLFNANYPTQKHPRAPDRERAS